MTRILVADDDQDVRAALRVALEVEIVAISGWQRAQRADHLAVALHAGADVILRKPFTPGDLLDKLRDCVLEHSAAGLPK